jgi:hypothetical protein
VPRRDLPRCGACRDICVTITTLRLSCTPWMDKHRHKMTTTIFPREDERLLYFIIVSSPEGIWMFIRLSGDGEDGRLYGAVARKVSDGLL